MEWDTRVSPTEVGIQVKQGVVTLNGMVDSWVKVRAAEEAAHRVNGVLDVANDLTVKLAGTSQRTDTDIAQTVRRALEWDVTVPDQKISSTVTHGVVTLEGKVAFWSQKADAERAVERLTGVARVLNRIEVKPKEEVNLANVRSAVATALEQRADREASRLTLHATDGTVDVSGVVHTWQERQAVLGAIRGTRGVRDVADHLSVQPYA
jgi:osmotically-inducible protein OsmY